MAHIEWDDELLTGIHIFDEHHKKWVDLYNEVYEAVVEMQGVDNTARVREAIEEFMRYTFYHLTAEENAMEKYNYPEIEEHRREHNKYRFLVKKVKNLYRANTEKGAELLLQFLHEWLFKHIKNTDQKYTMFLPSDLKQAGSG